MKHPSYLLISIIVCLLSCSSPVSTKPSSPIAYEANSLDGYWILKDYLDDILESKSIAKNRIKPVAWTAIALHIANDSASYSGIVERTETVPLRKNADSLTVIKNLVSAQDYIASYTRLTDLIHVEPILDTSKHSDTLQYTFRRLKEHEKWLVEGIHDDTHRFRLVKNFRKLFIDSLISGQYTPIDHDSPTLGLSASGLVNGFGNYQTYVIHDYFGTLHPYDNEDVIIFKDSTIVNPVNNYPIDSRIYNWKFKGDTLSLTEMDTKNHEQFFLGTKSYRYIKSTK